MIQTGVLLSNVRVKNCLISYRERGIEMNDTVKGISILTVTAVAISLVLNQDNKGLSMAFIKDKSEEHSDVLELQQAILRGEDPTRKQESTASGEQLLSENEKVIPAKSK